MGFQAIKSNDIIIHQGRQHVVTKVNLVDGDVRLHIQPIEDRVIQISYKDIDNSTEASSSSIIKAHRLVASKKAQSSMQYGWQYAKSNRKLKNAMPYSKDEVSYRIKSLLDNAIKQSSGDIISQDMLDGVVSRVAMAQGYMIAHYKDSAVKSRRDIATWEDIANVAIRLSNAYNKKRLDVRSV